MEVVNVKFHGDRIFLVDRDGDPYVAVYPVCENLGLEWEVEYERLTRSRKWRTREISFPTPEGLRQMLCIPLLKLGLWLASVPREKVKRELREKLVAYQEDCDMVLWTHWQKEVGFWQTETDSAVGAGRTVSRVEILEIKSRVERELKDELSTRLLKLAVSVEESGVSLVTAVKITRARRIGLSTEEVARALELDVDAVKNIEAVCKRTGFWKYFEVSG